MENIIYLIFLIIVNTFLLYEYKSELSVWVKLLLIFNISISLLGIIFGVCSIFLK